jgi:hypothetical protein
MKTALVITALCLLALALASSAANPVPTWFEQRMLTAHEYANVGPALELDRKNATKLVDLLVNHELQRQQHALTATHLTPDDDFKHMLERAEIETAQAAEVRELLGPEKFERFVDFKVSLMDRPFVTKVEQQLGRAHKLDAAQRERLVALYRDHRAHELDYFAAVNSIRPMGITSPEGLTRRYMIAGEELMFRSWPQATQRLLQSAAAFLSPPQLAVLEQVHGQEREPLREAIEDHRAKASLIRTIPARSDIDIPRVRSPVALDIKLTVEFIVNNQPTHFTHVGGNDTSVTFPIAEDLFVEAQPVLFDDDGFEVLLWCYEKSPAGQRLIAKLSDSGASHAMNMPPSLKRQGYTTEMIVGRKGYVIRYNSVVEISSTRN